MAATTVTCIDIGAANIRVAAVRFRKFRATVLAAGMAPLPEGERGKPPAPGDLARAVRGLLRKHDIPAKNLVVSLGGRPTMLKYMGVPVVPPWKLEQVMRYEVEEQVAVAGGIENIAYDYRILNIPGFDDGMFPVLVALAQCAALEERFNVARLAKLPGPVADLGSLGAFNLFALSPQCVDGEWSVLLDIGADETHFTLQNGNQLLFARTFPGGGNGFTERLRQTLGLLPLEAEAVKRAEGRIIDVVDTTVRAKPRRPGAAPGAGRTGIIYLDRKPAVSPGAPSPAVREPILDPLDQPPSPPPQPETVPAGTTTAAAERNDGGVLGLDELELVDDGPTPVKPPEPAAKAAGKSGTLSFLEEPEVFVDETPPADESREPLPEPTADGVAREPGAMTEEDRALAISRALRAEAMGLATQSKSLLRFFGQQFKLREVKPKKLFITGGGAQVAGLAEFLGRQLDLPAVGFDVADAVEMTPAAARSVGTGPAAGHWALSLGLAAGHAARSMYVTTLLPPKEKARRRFWERTAYNYYAGVLAAAALGIMAVRGCPGASGWVESRAEAERAAAWTGTLEASTGQLNALNEKLSENRRAYSHFLALTAGVESTADAIAALRECERVTPKNIVLLKFHSDNANAPETILRGGSAAAAGRVSQLALMPSVGEGGIHLPRVYRLTGYVVNASTRKEANAWLAEYALALEGGGTFQQVNIVRDAEVEPDKDTGLVAAYGARIVADNDAAVREPIKWKLSLLFELECLMAPRQKVAAPPVQGGASAAPATRPDAPGDEAKNAPPKPEGAP